jgi:hypothetical protein
VTAGAVISLRSFFQNHHAERVALDTIFITITFGFFLLTWGFVRLAAKV